MARRSFFPRHTLKNINIMLTKNKGRARAKNELQIAVINEARFAYEVRNGNMSFNLTQMSKPYGREKRPANWLKNAQAQEYLAAIPVAIKIATADNQGVAGDLIEVRQGGTPERQGTWTNDYRVAIEFARWLSPRFSIALNEMVFKILTRQVAIARAEPKHGVTPVIWEGKPVYRYTEVVSALGGNPRSGYSSRKEKFPGHFVKLFGRNFITPEYVDLLAGYYRYRNAQLSLTFKG